MPLDVPNYPPEDILLEDELYQYLLQPHEEHGDQCRRATDRKWSKGTYRLSNVASSKSNGLTYHLEEGSKI